MNEEAGGIPAIVDGGGFRIEILPGELKVTRDNSPDNPRQSNSVARYAVHAIVGLCILIRLLTHASRLFPVAMSLADTVMSNASLGIRLAAAGKILFPILVVWAVYAWSLSQLRKGYNDLKCTRTNLEVINTFRGQARSTQSFLKADVKQIKFGALSTFSTRPLMGLVFTAGNKQVKILEGLKCVEA